MTDTLAEGTRWRHLRVLALIGEGGYGRVYRAWDDSLDREVALKLIPATDDAAATAILEEGRRLARLRHPNIATVFGADRLDGNVGIWMEFIHGRTLAQIVADHGPLNAVEGAAVGRDVCRALAAVHAGNLLHGDVKAANVMRERGGRIVLMDFGASLERPLSLGPPAAGTLPYLAPELLDGEPASIASDVYAAGALLFYLTTGAYPATASGIDELRASHRDRRLRLLSDERPDLPAAFCEVVERAINPEPAMRFETAGALEQALAAIGHVAGESSPAQPPRPVRPWYHRRSWWLAIGTATALAIAASQLLARPTFTLGGYQSVPMNSEIAGVDGWASGFRARLPNPPDDRFEFSTTNDFRKLFEFGPVISPSGSLAYQVATNAVGTATVTVTLTDRWRPFGFNRTSAPQTFEITIVPPPHPPSAVDDRFVVAADHVLAVGLKSPPSGLTNLWHADQTFRDEVTGAVGVAAGAGFADGRSGSAFSLDGVDDVIALGRDAGVFRTGDFTLSFLVSSKAQRSEIILSKRSECGGVGSFFGLGIHFNQNGDRGGQLGSEFQGVTQMSPDNLFGIRQINDGVFHSIVVTRSGPVFMLYVDGIYDRAAVSSTAWDLSNGDELRIGIDACIDGRTREKWSLEREGRRLMPFDSHHFTGAVDELAFFNRALTVVEIRNLHHHGVLANDSNSLGDLMTAVLVAGTSHGDLQLHADGTFRYQPQRGFRGTDSFTYQARNANGELSAIATVTIAVR